MRIQRTLKLLLFTVLMCARLMVTASAEEISGTCGAEGDGSNLTWVLDTETGVLAISGRGEMAGECWEYRDDITVAVIENGVTTIGGRAFLGCKNLTKVELPESLERIEYFSFAECENLKEIYIPKNVTAIEEAFYNTMLEKIQVEAHNQQYCSEDGILYGFYRGNKTAELVCYAGSSDVESYTIKENVVQIRPAAFSGRTNLKTITLPESIQVIGDSGSDYGAFERCTNLENMIVPEGVEIIEGYTFFGCRNLKTIILPKSLTTIRWGAFLAVPLTDIYYAGNEEEWANISVSHENEALKAAKIHYNYIVEVPEQSEKPVTTVSGSISGGEGASIEIGGESVAVNEDGSFALPAEGEFDVVITKPGCLTYTIKGVTTVNGNVELPKVVMAAGDVNGDDKINISDMGAFRQEFGKTGENIGNVLTDVNNDGKVNIADMGIFRQNFGKTAEKDCTVQF